LKKINLIFTGFAPFVHTHLGDFTAKKGLILPNSAGLIGQGNYHLDGQSLFKVANSQ